MIADHRRSAFPAMGGEFSRPAEGTSTGNHQSDQVRGRGGGRRYCLDPDGTLIGGPALSGAPYTAKPALMPSPRSSMRVPEGPCSIKPRFTEWCCGDRLKPPRQVDLLAPQNSKHLAERLAVIRLDFGSEERIAVHAGRRPAPAPGSNSGLGSVQRLQSGRHEPRSRLWPKNLLIPNVC
jgi:hypothetical protein